MNKQLPAAGPAEIGSRKQRKDEPVIIAFLRLSTVVEAYAAKRSQRSNIPAKRNKTTLIAWRLLFNIRAACLFSYQNITTGI